MTHVLEGFLKLFFALILICIYYIITLVMSAYFISMSEKNLFGSLATDWKIANEKMSNNLISEKTTKTFNNSISVDISKYIKVILDNENNRNTYLFVSTMLLFIIAIIIYGSRTADNTSALQGKNENPYNSPNWLNKKDIATLKQRKVIAENQGIILGQFQKNSSKLLTLPSAGKTNKHILVVGNSGSGKSRAFVKTNIINLSKDWHSFVISDPKGEYLSDTAEILGTKGYDIKVLNLVNIKHSHKWNPMDYVTDAIDAQYLADIIIEKVHRDNNNDIDRNIRKIETELIKNLIIYIKEKFNKNVQNLNALYNIISSFNAKDIDELLMHESDLVNLSEYSFYLKQSYKDKEIAITDLIDQLNLFDMKTISNMLKTSEIKLEMPKIRPCAYYIILPDMHKELDLIASMFIAMMTKKITEVHDDTKDEIIRNREVYLILDEFANFGFIPKFADRISQFRARKINCSVIVNSISNIRNIYREEEGREITSNCDTKLFLGCNDDATAEYFATVIDKNTTGGMGLTMHDLINMDIDKCIAIIRGQKPAMLYKYDFTNLREYRQVAEKSKTGVSKWVAEKLGCRATKQSADMVDTDTQIKVYDYDEGIKQEINNILYYNDYKKGSTIKVFEEDIEVDENNDKINSKVKAE